MKKITIKKGDRFKSDGVEEIEKLLKTRYKTVEVKQTTGLPTHINVRIKGKFAFTVIVKDISFIAGTYQVVEVFGIFVNNDIIANHTF